MSIKCLCTQQLRGRRGDPKEDGDPSGERYCLYGPRHRYRCDSGSGFAIPKSPPRINDKDPAHPTAAAVAHVSTVRCPRVLFQVKAKRHLGCQQFASPRVGLECCGIQAGGCNGTMPCPNSIQATPCAIRACVRGILLRHCVWSCAFVCTMLRCRGVEFASAAAAMRTSLEFASRLNQLPHAKAGEDQSAGIYQARTLRHCRQSMLAVCLGDAYRSDTAALRCHSSMQHAVNTLSANNSSMQMFTYMLHQHCC